MELPFPAVLIHTVIIIKAVCQIGVLLDFGDQRARPDRVDRPCFNVKYIVLFDGYLLQIFFQLAVFYGAADGFLVRLMVQTVNQTRFGRRVEDIPHLRFSELTVFMRGGVFVIRMNLNGQILLRVDQFDQYRKFSLCARMRAQKFRMPLKHLRQRHSLECAADNGARPVGMRGTFPCFRQRRHRNVFPEIVIQPLAAPQIVLSDRF